MFETFKRRGFDLPPPFNLCPEYPYIYFDRFGVPRPDVAAWESQMVVQVVPAPGNPYIQRFDLRRDGWEGSDAAARYLRSWQEVSGEVFVHVRQEGVRTTGIGRDQARFLCGEEYTLFIGGEIGLLPRGVAVEGTDVSGMVVVFAVFVPADGKLPEIKDVAIHLLPREYLWDPPYPGFRGLNGCAGVRYELPPPPEFSPGDSGCPYPGFTFAKVLVGLSLMEKDGDSLEVDCQLLRGGCYRRLMGLPIV